MPTTPHQEASMTPRTAQSTQDRPTVKQLAYMRSLANRAGQTFTYPRTRAQASAEIRRLKTATPSTRVERQIERDDLASERAARAAGCLAEIAESEIEGYGSSATWSKRG
jgi:hypothetical protein